jgi:protein-S-isoprenylcysteine O-methyltransferase Ste14
MRPTMASPAETTPETQPKRKPLFRHPFRRKTLKPRTGVLYIAGAVALFAARPEAALFFPGLVLITIGQSLRAWATGYLLKTDELTTAGPYAHLRHPLYAGSLLMGCGFALAAGKLVAMVVIPLGVIFYFGYYLRYKERVESERLEAIYGDEFRAYRANVPALFPRLSAWHPPTQTEIPPWRLDRVIENDEQTALVYTVLALLTFVAIWWYRSV